MLRPVASALDCAGLSAAVTLSCDISGPAPRELWAAAPAFQPSPCFNSALSYSVPLTSHCHSASPSLSLSVSVSVSRFNGHPLYSTSLSPSISLSLCLSLSLSLTVTLSIPPLSLPPSPSLSLSFCVPNPPSVFHSSGNHTVSHSQQPSLSASRMSWYRE